jgi:hypothetical protein
MANAIRRSRAFKVELHSTAQPQPEAAALLMDEPAMEF